VENTSNNGVGKIYINLKKKKYNIKKSNKKKSNFENKRTHHVNCRGL